MPSNHSVFNGFMVYIQCNPLLVEIGDEAKR